MYEIINLMEEVPEGFAALINGEGQRLLKEVQGEAYAIGMLLDETPIGAVVFDNCHDGSAKLVSLYVTEEERRKGCGTELIYRSSLLLSADEEINRIEAAFAENEYEEPGLKDFFTWLEFQITPNDTMGAYLFRMEDAAKSPLLIKADKEGVVSWKDIPDHAKDQLLLEHPQALPFVKNKRLEKYMSCVVEKELSGEGHPGCLLFSLDDTELTMLWAETGQNKLDLMHLFKHALDLGLSRYGEEMLIRVPYINATSKNLVEKLIGDSIRSAETVYEAVFPLSWEEEEVTW